MGRCALNRRPDFSVLKRRLQENSPKRIRKKISLPSFRANVAFWQHAMPGSNTRGALVAELRWAMPVGNTRRAMLAQWGRAKPLGKTGPRCWLNGPAANRRSSPTRWLRRQQYQPDAPAREMHPSTASDSRRPSLTSWVDKCGFDPSRCRFFATLRPCRDPAWQEKPDSCPFPEFFLAIADSRF